MPLCACIVCVLSITPLPATRIAAHCVPGGVCWLNFRAEGVDQCDCD